MDYLGRSDVIGPYTEAAGDEREWDVIKKQRL